MATNPNTPKTLFIEGAERQEFQINGDPNKILRINITDSGIIERLQKYYPELEKLSEKADIAQRNLANLDEDNPVSDANKKITAELRECDTEMRKFIDLLFDANVSEVCDEGGMMYDFLPKSGQQRYENIVASIMTAYQDTLGETYKLIQQKRESHTKKYTKKKK